MIETSTPGSTPELVSRTRPVIVPVIACAAAHAGSAAMNTNVASNALVSRARLIATSCLWDSALAYIVHGIRD